MRQVNTNDVDTLFDRIKEKKPCPFGTDGGCCKMCHIGPCRVSGADVGVCGASAETIAARNFGRMIAGGTAAHSDYARDVALLFLDAAMGEAPDYEIKDKEKLLQLAIDFGVKTKDRSSKEIAIDVGEAALAEFGKQKEEPVFIKRAPASRQELWKRLEIVPRGIDRETVEMIHRTHVGVDHDYENIILHGCRTALADGWGASMIATELQDILFGVPTPAKRGVDLGVLKDDEVNIILHGHEPLFAEMMVQAARDKGLLELARSKGAGGINLAEICPAADRFPERHNITIAGTYLQQELAIMTSAVEVMVLGTQCIMPSLPAVANCCHTKIITTSKKAKLPGAVHLQLHRENALDVAKDIVKRAVENYINRKTVNIPQNRTDMMTGFRHETINRMIGGISSASYSPLNDNIISGKIRGIAGVISCNNPRANTGYVYNTLVRELIANNVLVLVAGCGAINAACARLLIPEAAELAGSGLQEVCEAAELPPVLHVGSCINSSQILTTIAAAVKDGGLGDDIHQVPAVGCAPEWMSERAIAVGQCLVASGVMTVFGVGFPSTGSEVLSNFLFEKIEEVTGGMWAVEPDPLEMAKMLIDRIDNRRKALGI